MKTQNKTKAKEIAEKLGTDVFGNGTGKSYCKEDVIQSAINAMLWKDKQHEKEKQQMIDRATKWFSENYCYITDKHYDVEVVHELIDELKQTMKGE